jgi:hypothetical protein
VNRPPLWMHLRFRDEMKDSHFGLWLPLFLLLPLLLILLIVLSPLVLIALLVLWPSGWSEWALRALWSSFVVFFSLRGLEVNVKNRDQHVYISVT